MRAMFSMFTQSSMRRLAWLLLAVCVSVQVACATTPRVTNHTFEFDARWDSPGIEILNYRYGNSKQPGARPPEYMLTKGKVAQQVGISGDMLRGDDLYVKWRIKSTGEIFEDTVNLKDRLPADIINHRIRFIIKGPQLYVYLVTPEKLIPNPCPLPDQRRLFRLSDVPDKRIFSLYCSTRILRLYPGQSGPLDIE